jgi:tetratricopeptide (TPR) repeat protein
VAADSRIEELRRRVEADPASIAFAQLAEEYRRGGALEEAVNCCRRGLARHPGYLSARATLGRALLDLGSLDEAGHELELVLQSAPDNLAAIRAMADLHQRRGDLEQSLKYYKRALAVARFDPHLEDTVSRIDREISGVSQSPTPPTASRAPLMDLDALLASLGMPNAPAPPAMERLLSQQAPAEPAPTVPSDSPRDTAAPDVFAELENDLRSFERPPEKSAEDAMIEALEEWLQAVETAREDRRKA